MLLSTGERTTMALLCIALIELGIDAVSSTGSQAGIVTNDVHNDAKVIEVRPFRVQDEMEKGKVVVVGGFQGVSYKRDITTLGRGGSDMTAVALAAALECRKMRNILRCTRCFLLRSFNCFNGDIIFPKSLISRCRR